MKGYFTKQKHLADGKNAPEKGARTKDDYKSSTRWTVTYDEPVAPGERRKQRRKTGFPTRKAAEAWFNEKRQQLERGFSGVDEKATVAQYMAHWLSNTKASVGAGAYHRYETYTRRFIVPVLGKLRLCDLRPSHLDEAKRNWARTPKRNGVGFISPRTVHHIWMTLVVSLSRAHKQRIILENPCAFVDAPRFERAEMKALPARAASQYLQAFADETDIGAAIVTAIGSGLRRGELLALRWCDVDLEAGTLRVARALERALLHDDLADPSLVTGVEIRFKEPKTNTSRRTIPLPAFAIARLRRHRAEQGERLFKLGRPPTGDTLLFEREGLPWCPNTFGLWFTKAIKRMGLPRVRLHDLRHSYASLMLESGVDLKTVSTALGHSTIRVTADTYAHVSPAMLQGAADKLDRIIGSEG